MTACYKSDGDPGLIWISSWKNMWQLNPSQSVGQHIPPVDPVFPHICAHMWLNLPRYWQVAVWSAIGQSPYHFLCPAAPWSHTLLLLEPSVCFGNCIWQAKEQAIYVKREGEAFHSLRRLPSDLISLNSAVFKRGPDLLVFVLWSIVVAMAAGGRCLVHYCICFCGVCSESAASANSQQGTIESNYRGAAVCFVWLHSWCGALLSKFAHTRTACPLFYALFSL